MLQAGRSLWFEIGSQTDNMADLVTSERRPASYGEGGRVERIIFLFFFFKKGNINHKLQPLSSDLNALWLAATNVCSRPC